MLPRCPPARGAGEGLRAVRAATDLKACTRPPFLRAFQVSIRSCQRCRLSSSCFSVASIRLTDSCAMALRLPSRAWFMTCGHRQAGRLWMGGRAPEGQNKAPLGRGGGRLEREGVPGLRVAVTKQVVQYLRSTKGHWALAEAAWGSVASDGDRVSFSRAPEAPQLLITDTDFVWFGGVMHSSALSVFNRFFVLF